MSDDTQGRRSSVRIDVRIAPDEDLFEKLKDSARQFTTVLQLSTNDEKEPANLVVTLVRPALVKPLVGRIRSTDSGYLCEVELLSDYSDASFEVQEYRTVGRQDSLSVEPADKGNKFTIRWPPDSTDDFLGLLKFVVKGEWGEEVVVVSF